MSTMAMAWAWGLQGLDPPQKLTILALAEGANHQGQCWPTKATLQSMTGMSETAVAHCLKELALRGLIEREEVAGQPARVFLRLDAQHRPAEKPKRELVPFQAPLETMSMMDQAMVIWNEMAARTKAGPKDHRISSVEKLTDDMRRKLAPRLKDAGLDGWARCVQAIEQSAHCRGVNDSKWRADFHYLLQAKGFSKTLNGGWPADYEEKTNGGQRIGPSGRGDQRLDGLRGFDAAVRGRLAAGPGREGGGEDGGGDAGAPGRGAGSAQPRLALDGPPDA